MFDFTAIIGYVASVLVAVSLMMTSVLKLRIINLLGAISFTIYGLLIGAYPVIVVNAFIVVVNLYFLYNAFTAKEYFKLLIVQPNSEYLQYFLDFHEAEVRRCVPSFTFQLHEGQITLFILRNMVPTGVLIAEPADTNALRVKLDFVIPGYRDFKVGKFLFREKAEFFKERGFFRIYSESDNKVHTAYLKSVGFKLDNANAGNESYSLTLG